MPVYLELPPPAFYTCIKNYVYACYHIYLLLKSLITMTFIKISVKYFFQPHRHRFIRFSTCGIFKFQVFITAYRYLQNTWIKNIKP